MKAGVGETEVFVGDMPYAEERFVERKLEVRRAFNELE